MIKIKGLLLVPDGIVYPLFKDMLKKGDLLNVSKYIYDRKLVEVENAFCCHPSSTFENMQAINTGRFPHDPGATSYSRQTGAIKDLLRLDNPSKGNCAKRDTIFSMIPDYSISIHNSWNDGADDKHPNIYTTSSFHYLRGWNGSNSAATGRYVKTLNNRKPIFTEIWFPAYDRFAHTHSNKSLMSKYLGLDEQIGKIGKALEEKGQLDDTLLVFLADHSMADVKENVNPNLICKNAGFLPRIGRRRNGFDSRVFSYGYGIGQIYLTNGTKEKVLEERIMRLLEEDSVEHVVVKKEDKRIVYSKSSIVEISKIDDKYQMKILKGNNPFGYSDELCEKLGEVHNARESLELTCLEEQPDAVVGIAESMHHHDSPDIRLLASERYDFGKMRNYTHFPAFFNANRIRTHGNLHRSNSQIPFVIAGPRVIEPKKVLTARIIDWVPTFLELAGYEVPSGLDGESLV